MTTSTSPNSYVLGGTDAEHERLLRQAARLAPYTERLFRDAGIGRGQRVLDIGSGVGDVAMLVARLVGPTGHVIGIDRDGTALEKARARASASGMGNIQFVEAEVTQVPADTSFDAVVGRLILQFLPDPTAVLQMLTATLRPAGVMAFHEANWPSLLAQAAHLPLRSACGQLIVEAFRRSGARTDMELTLFRAFQQTGWPAPELRLETPIGNDPETRRWIYDLMCTVYPRFAPLGISSDSLGDLSTLSDRLEAELDATRSYAACIGLVGVWARKPNV